MALEEKINNLVVEKTAAETAKICHPDYFKNKFLEYAIKTYISPMQVQLAYIEMLFVAYQYTKDPVDLLHIKQLLSRMKMIGSKNQIDYLNDLVNDLKNAVTKQFKNIVLDVPGRLKSMKSAEAKLRTKLVKKKVYQEIMNELPYMEDFSKKEKHLARRYISDEMMQENATYVTDTFGVRIILYTVDDTQDEQYMSNFICNEFRDFLETFLNNHAIEIKDIDDYINNPKDNNYQSLHFKVESGDFFFEIQIRTLDMHKRAEGGEASHEKYKNTEIQNFVRDIMYKASDGRVEMNERLGILKEQTLSSTICSSFRVVEIPETSKQIKTFENLEFVKSVMSFN